jgi:hypothetical protein
MSQRIALAQTELQLVQSNPEIHGNEQGLYQAYRKMYEALGVTNVDAILPPPPVPQPTNPAKENQEAMRGKSLQAFPEQNHQAHIEAHLAIISTPVAQANASVVMTLQGHIQEHIGFMAESMAQQEIMQGLSEQEMMMLQSSPEGMQAVQADIASRAAVLIGEITEEYSQALAPSQQQDPLVAIRQQELAIRQSDVERRAKEAEDKIQLEREKELADQMQANERLNIQEKGINERTRVAEERIQTQRDIAALNSINKRR